MRSFGKKLYILPSGTECMSEPITKFDQTYIIWLCHVDHPWPSFVLLFILFFAFFLTRKFKEKRSKQEIKGTDRNLFCRGGEIQKVSEQARKDNWAESRFLIDSTDSKIWRSFYINLSRFFAFFHSLLCIYTSSLYISRFDYASVRKIYSKVHIDVSEILNHLFWLNRIYRTRTHTR